jgi:hypothetical protein
VVFHRQVLGIESRCPAPITTIFALQAACLSLGDRSKHERLFDPVLERLELFRDHVGKPKSLETDRSEFRIDRVLAIDRVKPLVSTRGLVNDAGVLKGIQNSFASPRCPAPPP